MKKGITILLLLSIFIEVAGYRIFFSAWEHQVRLSMKSNLRKNLYPGHTESFRFTTNEWARIAVEDDEFSYNDRMYDVVEKQVTENFVAVKCISDDKETRLVNSFLSFSHNIFGRDGAKKAALLLKLVSSPYVHPKTLDFSTGEKVPVEYASVIMPSVFSSRPDVLTPPPQCI